MATKREVAETWFRRVWKERDATAIQDMLVPDTTAHGLGAHLLVGPDDFGAFHAQFLGIVDDVDIVIDKMLEDDDWASMLITIKCTLKNGKRDAIGGQVWVRIADDKIVEAYNQVDFMSLFEKAGQLPPNCLAKCLCGEKLAS